MALSIFISMLYLAAVIVWRPFQTKSHNEVMITGQFVVCVTVAGGYVVETISEEKGKPLGWILLFVNIGIIFVTLYHRRSERLFNVVNALHSAEHFSSTEVAALWEGAPKITLTSALLEGAAKALTKCEQAENEDQADVHWKYLTEKLFKLQDLAEEKFIFNEEIPGQVDWLPIVDAVIHSQLEAARLHSISTLVTLKEGWCRKKGQVNPAWKRRYLLLGRAPENTHAELFFFYNDESARKLVEDSEDQSAGSINFRKVKKIDRLEGRMILELVDSSGRRWKFQFTESEEYFEWAEAFEQALEHSPDNRARARTMSANQFRKAANSTFGLLLQDDELDNLFETYLRGSTAGGVRRSASTAFQSTNPLRAHVDKVEHVGGGNTTSPSNNPLMATNVATPPKNDAFAGENPISHHRPSTFSVHANNFAPRYSENEERRPSTFKVHADTMAQGEFGAPSGTVDDEEGGNGREQNGGVEEKKEDTAAAAAAEEEEEEEGRITAGDSGGRGRASSRLGRPSSARMSMRMKDLASMYGGASGGSDDKDEGPNPVQLALLEDDSDEEMEIVLDIESGLSRESDKYETSTVTEEANLTRESLHERDEEEGGEETVTEEANLTRESLRERDEEEGGEDIETPVEDESDDNWDNDGKKAAAPGTPRQSQRKSLFGLVEERPETAYSTDGHDRMTTHQRSSIAAVKRASVRRASVAAELEDHLKSAGPAETIFDVPQVRASLRRASSISMSAEPQLEKQQAVIHMDEIDVLFKALANRIREGSAVPTLFAVVQTLGGDFHRRILERQQGAANEATADPKWGSKLKELTHVEDKAKMAQAIVGSKIDALLAASTAVGHRGAIDEQVLPALMTVVAAGVRDKFGDKLLAAVPKSKMYHEKHDGEEGEKEKDGETNHAAAELKVGPIKKSVRIGVKVREYRKEKGDEKFPHSKFMTDILRASFICTDAKQMVEAFEGILHSPDFQVVRLKNKIGEGKAPYNLHANVIFHPEECEDPILTEVQFYIKSVFELQHVQHLAYQLRRAKGLNDLIA